MKEVIITAVTVVVLLVAVTPILRAVFTWPRNRSVAHLDLTMGKCRVCGDITLVLAAGLCRGCAYKDDGAYVVSECSTARSLCARRPRVDIVMKGPRIECVKGEHHDHRPDDF